MLFVYASAIVAYTLFPLPGALSAEFCARHGRPVVLDPTAYFREMPARLAGLTMWQALRSGYVMQMVLNVALFVPLGVLGIHFARWPVWRSVATGLGVSLLVEATQYTGTWFLYPCPYRLADVNDLLTNTTGTLLGAIIGLLLPRLLADPAVLEQQAHRARPVTRWRRWAAMLIDAWVLGTALLVAVVVALTIFGLSTGNRYLTPAEQEALVTMLTWVGIGVAIAVGVVPSLLRGHASIGQRVVWLRPVPVDGGRSRFVTPALVRGLALVAFFTQAWVLTIVGGLWLLLDVLWVAWDPRGLSGVVTGYDVADARA